ncbi:N-acyl-D-amino-acid deacylase family protein [Paraburkholderia terrae]|uniref:D-aminoacylase n=1 Tax=Paraburkholderia terrae TaxID=311230 RepID=A0A2I8F4X3_9BURK|nr:D-aminoacylase [Paraburkholderia terrae]AUT66895.1 D-aminoacylase [Paraburkholderia terrae]
MSEREKFDLLILNGTLIDGTGRSRFASDIGIIDGKIADIGDLSSAHSRQSIDATGLIVAPGFIDAHTHDDQAIFAEPKMVSKISQGITTVVTGNCGISSSPLPDRVPLPDPLNLLKLPLTERFKTFEAFLRAIDSHPPSLNVAPLIGHTTLRVFAMSDVSRPATLSEICSMRSMTKDALAAGAIGLSSGIFYPPAAAATKDELIGIGASLREYDGVFAMHLRDESDHIVEAIEEAFEIGRALGIQIVLSHHKLMRERNFGKSRVTVPMIQNAMRCQCISLDCYPYTAGSSMIRDDDFVNEGHIVIVSSESHPECTGRSLEDIAREFGMNRREAARQLQPGTATYHFMCEEDVREILQFEHTMIGSDGLQVGERPHPRLWGTFPRVLGHYVREVGLFSLEEAVRKMTSLPARNFGLKNRGTLSHGYYADISIFDPDSIRDQATYENPTAPSSGVVAVIVNGAPTYIAGQHTGLLNGSLAGR